MYEAWDTGKDRTMNGTSIEDALLQLANRIYWMGLLK
jgi:hypothetical protein